MYEILLTLYRNMSNPLFRLYWKIKEESRALITFRYAFGAHHAHRVVDIGVQINHQQNPLKSMLLNFFLSSLRRTIPQSRWDNYLLASGEWSEVDVRRFPWEHRIVSDDQYR